MTDLPHILELAGRTRSGLKPEPVLLAPNSWDVARAQLADVETASLLASWLIDDESPISDTARGARASRDWAARTASRERDDPYGLNWQRRQTDEFMAELFSSGAKTSARDARRWFGRWQAWHTAALDGSGGAVDASDPVLKVLGLETELSRLKADNGVPGRVVKRAADDLRAAIPAALDAYIGVTRELSGSLEWAYSEYLKDNERG